MAPDPRHLCPQLNLLNPPPKKIPGYATAGYQVTDASISTSIKML